MQLMNTIESVINTPLQTADSLLNIVTILAHTAEIYAGEVELDAKCDCYCSGLDRTHKQATADIAHDLRMEELEVECE